MIDGSMSGSAIRSAICTRHAQVIFWTIWILAGLTSPVLGEVLMVDRDLQLDPDAVYDGIVITASDITIDGRGARLRGPGGTSPSEFRGTAVRAEGVARVTLKNLRAHGWERGLHLTNVQHWTIEDCDFSDNFHAPDFGWGENGRRGGVLLERASHCTLRRCRANRVWDGCVLVDSDYNLLEQNDFSYASNTCLKLWHSSHNHIHDNQLTHGIRKRPDEVHARDSTCVLIESGSDHNRFVRNDCRFGGDGIFIRVLNGWVSSDNYFEQNDCSYANNNCVEAWSPRNTWVRNRANHGSYGFWLGASDKNQLIENEACYNGLPEGNHNSPHLPESCHAGIVFMFGPSSHTMLRGNLCRGNHGAGIAAIGDLESRGARWNAFHWVVTHNRLEENRWGIYLQHAEMITLIGNHSEANQLADVWCAENVSALEQLDAGEPTALSDVSLTGPAVVSVGRESVWTAVVGSRHEAPQAPVDTVPSAGIPELHHDAREDELLYHWRLQRGDQVDPAGIAPAPAHTGKQWSLKFAEPGFYRLALTVRQRTAATLEYRDIYAVRDTSLSETADEPTTWSWSDLGSEVQFERDAANRLVGNDSLRATIAPYSGGRVLLRHTLPQSTANLSESSSLEFWLKYRNENVPAWQDKNPIVILHGDDGGSCELTPSQDLLSKPPYLEAREGWTLVRVPLRSAPDWQCEGEIPKSLTAVSLGFDSWGAPPLILWIDGLALLP